MTKNLSNNMLYNRQRALLGVMKQLNSANIKSKTYLVKTVFLLKQEGFNIDYDFFPYQYGPFSQTIYWDLDYLKKEGLISSDERRITSKGKEKIRIDSIIIERVNELTKKISDSKKIIDFVYKNYPEYTEKSILLSHEKTKQNGKFTIGYEGKSLDFFMNQLIQNNITKLIDVRKNAFSMKRGFSKSTLKETVEKAGILYEHVPRLGIESDKRQKLETKEDYEKLFKDYKKTLSSKKNELEYIEAEGKNERIAIMCFEKEHEYCHRGQISDFVGGFEHL